MRHALHFTPPSADRLDLLSSRWPGRNAFAGRAIETKPARGLPAADVLARSRPERAPDMGQVVDAGSLPGAIGMVASGPARAAGVDAGLPVVRTVRRQGARVV